MDIYSFSFSNYKSFLEELTIELRPLTLLFGYNSSGKSAALRFLPLLRDSVKNRGSSPIYLNSDATRGASFSDLVSKHSSTPAFEFKIRFGADGGCLSYRIRDLPEARRQVVEAMSFEVPNGKIISLDWLLDDSTPSDIDHYNVNFGDKVNTNVPVTFNGLIPSTTDEKNNVGAIAVLTELFFRESAEKIYWLQATRALPARRETFLGTPQTISADGAGITQMLFQESLRGTDVIENISNWYQEATNHRLILSRGAFGEAELFSFSLEAARGKGRPIALADTGEGMGQVLPVIALLVMAELGRLGTTPIIAIEHPELHLHRAAEPALAKLLCQAASNGNSKVLIETHSENLLLAVQLGLIEGRLRPDQVLVYWVNQSEGGPAKAERVEFDELGRPVGDWPPNVFMENAAQARKIVRARLARGDDAG